MPTHPWPPADGCDAMRNAEKEKSVPSNLGRIYPKRKTGGEVFRKGKDKLSFDLLSFWKWSCSDLVSNATRGILAEYIVARALGLAKNGVRDEWAPYVNRGQIFTLDNRNLYKSGFPKLISS